jgi:hypothetical protein
MTGLEWLSLLVMLAASAGSVMWLLGRGGRLQRVEQLRFVCPRLGETVSCRASQDVRIGQWLRVESCSAFRDDEPLTCDRECLRQMNLGRRLPAPAA